MDKESALTQTNSTPLIPRPNFSQFRTPNSLLWLSRKVGRVATLQLSNVREILAKERRLPTTEQLLGTSDPLAAIRRAPRYNPNDPGEEKKQLDDIVKQSHEVLAKSKTIFPFTLFPDTVLVDRTKVTIIQRNFFWSENVVSIRIEDVLNATAGFDLFFGSLNVSSRVMNSTDHYQIRFLWKRDAMHLKHLIQGYVIAQHNDIDVAHLPREKLIQTLCELGDDSRT